MLGLNNSESTHLVMNKSRGDRRERYIPPGNAKANAAADF